MCMAGDFSSALTSLFPSVNAPASHFTPDLFLFYLKVFETATAPKLTPVSKPGELCCAGAAWESIEGPAEMFCFFGGGGCTKFRSDPSQFVFVWFFLVLL